MTASLDHFETSLLTALREHVADRAPAAGAGERGGHGSPSVRRRPPRRVLAGLATVAAAVVGLILVPGVGSTPAYSVQEGNSGEIEVQVNRFEDSEGLERALAEHGIHAEITYVPDGGQCVPGRYRRVDRPGLSMSLAPDLFRITVAPGTVRAGETLVIDASLVRLPDRVDPDTGYQISDAFTAWVDAEVAQGPVPPCVVAE
jgi:hypothetical protein